MIGKMSLFGGYVWLFWGRSAQWAIRPLQGEKSLPEAPTLHKPPQPLYGVWELPFPDVDESV